MTTYRWDRYFGIARYACAGRMFPYGRVLYRPNDSAAHTAVIHTQVGYAVTLGAFNTEAEARAVIEAVAPLYLAEFG
jgi:hypothetical protein